MSGQTCTFGTGGTTVSSYCEAGCCTDACCGETEISPTTIAIIVCSTVGGLVILLLMACCIFFCIRNRKWCQEKGDAERAKPKKIKKVKPEKKDAKADKVKKIGGDDKAKVNWVINGNWDWHGWKKQQYGEVTRATQTDKHKLQPGDYILWSKSKWFPVKRDKNAIADPRTNIKEIGVNTVKDGPYDKMKDKKKKATSTGTGSGTGTGTGTGNAYPTIKSVAPVDTRVVTPSQIQPVYTLSSGKVSDDGYASKAISSTDREHTSDSLKDSPIVGLPESNVNTRAGGEPFNVLHDPNREERDRLDKVKNGGYASPNAVTSPSTWAFPEVKRWNPHSKGTDPKNSKWAKAHDYAKNLNTNK